MSLFRKPTTRASRVSALLVSPADEQDSDLTAVLENIGFHVSRARGFEEVRQAGHADRPDIVILHTSGTLAPELALCSSVRAVLDDAFVPLVVLADSASTDDEIMALSAGVDAFLTGPVHPMLLSARLHSLLRIKALHDELISTNARLEELSRIDPGTGLYNRRYFFERLEEEFERVKRNNEPLSVLMLDIDKFKKANDRYGHVFGDFVLKRLAETLEDACRRIDIVARYGGEEFAFILPGTKVDSAMLLAERIRRTVAATVFASDEAKMRLTVSIGVAESSHCAAADTDALVQCADKALYQAKVEGRNRISVYGKTDLAAPVNSEDPPHGL